MSDTGNGSVTAFLTAYKKYLFGESKTTKNISFSYEDLIRRIKPALPRKNYGIFFIIQECSRELQTSIKAIQKKYESKIFGPKFILEFRKTEPSLAPTFNDINDKEIKAVDKPRKKSKFNSVYHHYAYSIKTMKDKEKDSDKEAPSTTDKTTTATTLYIRLYPNQLTEVPAAIQYRTVPLSDGKFIQVRSTDSNKEARISCLAITTEDTGWDLIYKEVFAALIKNGITKGKLKVGPYYLDDMWLKTHPRITDNMRQFTYFTLSFIGSNK